MLMPLSASRFGLSAGCAIAGVISIWVPGTQVGAAICGVWGAGRLFGVINRQRELDDQSLPSADEIDDALFDLGAGLITDAWCTGDYHPLLE